VAASGLQIGQTVSEDDFQQTVRRLGGSGAFTNVGYTFQYSPEGTRLELHVSDAPSFVPATFENLVWFSDDELVEKVHSEVPLFRGQLPITGDLPDQVSEALQAILILQKVPGRVDYLRVARGEDGPIEAIAYTVTGGAQIVVGAVSFTGAGAAEQAPLGDAGKQLEGSDYRRSLIVSNEERTFLPILLERGYLRAAFGKTQAKVVRSDAQQVVADVTIPVEEGNQYTVSAVELSGNTTIASPMLRKTLHQHEDQTANPVQLDEDIKAMKMVYGTRGYMEAKITADATLNDEQHTVRYLIGIQEGDVYKMGDLEIQGLDSRTTARLEDIWKLRGGDPYDSSYPKQFLEQASKEIAEIGKWETKVRESLDPSGKTVDVTIRFDPRR